ncbi:MAG: DUF2279 domain-containing protein [Gemmatimonadaceae bacterium]
MAQLTNVGRSAAGTCIAAMVAVVFSGATVLAQTLPDSLTVARGDSTTDLMDRARIGVRPSSFPNDTTLRTRPAPSACANGQSGVALRRGAVAATFVGGNAALYSYFKRAWWSGEKSEGFFFNADWDETFRDQDKFGHLHGGYHLARFGNALLRGACVGKGRANLWSAVYAAAFQLQIEIWDGKYEKYGFSYPDLIANTTGTAIAVVHTVYPGTRAIKPTISYFPTAALRNADNVPGELRPSLDYSGQTYWVSADVDALLPENAKRYWPAFLRVSAGHSITDWIDPATGANLRAKRRILLTLDFDAEKLPGENRIWKTIKRQLGYIHLPSPALQLTPEFEGISWYR